MTTNTPILLQTESPRKLGEINITSLMADATAAGENQVPTTWADMAGVIGPIAWAWPAWLPRAMLTIVASEPGIGKSILALRIAACFIRGDPWPDGKPFEGELGAVLWCEAEAAQALNLERAKAWGLPLDKIYTLTKNPLEDLSLENNDHKAALVEGAMRPEVRFVVVDSLSGADPKAEKSTEDSSNIKWLAELARDSGKPFFMTHHLRKRSIFDGDTVNLDRLRGASAIVQTARLVWALDIPDPQTKDWLRLMVVKDNLGKFPDPIGANIQDTGVTFGLAPEVPKIETVADKAADLLLALLRQEPMAASDLINQFEQAGISWRSAERAKVKLGISSVKIGDRWLWSLPAKEGEGVN